MFKEDADKKRNPQIFVNNMEHVQKTWDKLGHILDTFETNLVLISAKISLTEVVLT